MRILFTLFFSVFLLNAKSETVKGKVIDAKTKETLIGVSVNVKNTLTGASTDLDGKFEFAVDSLPVTLVFAYVGYIGGEIIVKDKSSITVSLIEDAKSLDELVVTAKAFKREARTTSASITTVTSSGLMSVTPGVSVSYDKGDYYIKKDAGGRIPTYEVEKIYAGTLTAGEVNDFSKWKLWNDKSQEELRKHKEVWKLAPAVRFSVLVQNKEGFPLIGQQVDLVDNNGNIVWTAMTDNIGKAELWVNMYDSSYSKKEEFSIISILNKTKYEIRKAKPFNNGINHLIINKPCNIYNSVEAVFVVDATGSMGDEIKYLKTELNNVIQQVKDTNPQLALKLGSVFYRDIGDKYVTRVSELSYDISKTTDFIREQAADGGGDFPEAVDEALNVAINDIKWNDTTRAKIIFLVLDAPPHDSSATLKKMEALIKKAAAKGIKIVPVTASGIDKSTEYLMRSWALCTNGTYVFLTDHSGVGDHHIEPTTDAYKVEKLNDLLVRVFNQFTTVVSCENNIVQNSVYDTSKIAGVINTPIDTATVKDTSAVKEQTFSCLFYPNPTSGIVNVDITGNINELFLNDLSGKILERFEVNGRTTFQIDLSAYPKGIYLITYFGKNDRPISGRIVLVK